MIKWKSTKFLAYDSKRFKSKIVICYSSMLRETTWEALLSAVSIASSPPEFCVALATN